MTDLVGTIGAALTDFTREFARFLSDPRPHGYCRRVTGNRESAELVDGCGIRMTPAAGIPSPAIRARSRSHLVLSLLASLGAPSPERFNLYFNTSGLSLFTRVPLGVSVGPTARLPGQGRHRQHSIPHGEERRGEAYQPRQPRCGASRTMRATLGPHASRRAAGRAPQHEGRRTCLRTHRHRIHPSREAGVLRGLRCPRKQARGRSADRRWGGYPPPVCGPVTPARRRFMHRRRA